MSVFKKLPKRQRPPVRKLGEYEPSPLRIPVPPGGCKYCKRLSDGRVEYGYVSMLYGRNKKYKIGVAPDMETAHRDFMEGA